MIKMFKFCEELKKGYWQGRSICDLDDEALDQFSQIYQLSIDDSEKEPKLIFINHEFYLRGNDTFVNKGTLRGCGHC